MSIIEIAADDRTRLSVLDAAEALFERYGYRKTTVEEIAQEAGIGKGTIYLHFKSKEEIALHWLKRIHEGVFDTLQQAGEKASESLASKIEAILVARVLVRFDIFDRHRRSMDEVLDSLQACLKEKRDAFHARESQLIQSLIERGVAVGEFSTSTIISDADAMITATNSLCPYNVRPTQLGERSQVEKRAKELAALLVRGIQRGEKL